MRCSTSLLYYAFSAPSAWLFARTITDVKDVNGQKMILIIAKATMAVYCAKMGEMTVTAEQRKRQGVTRELALLESQLSFDPRYRRAGSIIVDYVYNFNDDNGLSPQKMGAIVRNACQTPE